MIKAIVYTSNSGSTKKYAIMLGEELGLPVYSYKEAKMIFTKEDEIIYMGWVAWGRVVKYFRAVDLFDVKAVCAVGIHKTKSIAISKIKSVNFIDKECFYLRGAYDRDKQHGIVKILMKVLTPIIKLDIRSNNEATLSDLEHLDMLYNGRDYVTKEELKDVIKWVRNYENEICRI